MCDMVGSGCGRKRASQIGDAAVEPSGDRNPKLVTGRAPKYPPLINSPYHSLFVPPCVEIMIGCGWFATFQKFTIMLERSIYKWSIKIWFITTRLYVEYILKRLPANFHTRYVEFYCIQMNYLHKGLFEVWCCFASRVVEQKHLNLKVQALVSGSGLKRNLCCQQKLRKRCCFVIFTAKTIKK